MPAKAIKVVGTIIEAVTVTAPLVELKLTVGPVTFCMLVVLAAKTFWAAAVMVDKAPFPFAMPAFAAYLCSFENTQKGTHVFAVDRGDAESRRSVINLEMDNKGHEQLPLRVGGEAVLFAQGTIDLPE